MPSTPPGDEISSTQMKAPRSHPAPRPLRQQGGAPPRWGVGAPPVLSGWTLFSTFACARPAGAGGWGFAGRGRGRGRRGAGGGGAAAGDCGPLVPDGCQAWELCAAVHALLGLAVGRSALVGTPCHTSQVARHKSQVISHVHMRARPDWCDQSRASSAIMPTSTQQYTLLPS